MDAIYRPFYSLYRLGSGVRHRAERRLTKGGVGVLLGLAAVSMLAPDTENTVAYQAVGLLFSILLVSGIFCGFFRGRFAVQRRLARFGSVGFPLSYTVLVRNLTSKTQAGLVLFENLADPRPPFDEWRDLQLADQRELRSFRVSRGRNTNPFKRAAVAGAEVPTMRPGEEVEVKVELIPVRRGPLRFNGMTLARPDPLGLMRSFITLPAPEAVLILPKRYALGPIALPGIMKHQDGGVALASNVGQSDEFIGLREYRHGDPVRHIHWRTWARAGRPVVKQFEDEFFVRHALVLDTFTYHPQSEVFEEAVSVAASFACTLQTQESLLDLLFVGPQSYRFTVGRGLAHTDQMLEILASVGTCRNQRFDALEQLVLENIGVVSGCVCVLVDWDQERRDFVEKLRILGVPVLVIVIVSAGQKTTLDPGPMRAEPERFVVLEAGRIQEGLERVTSV
jgi:uncharacterized protein (DUF58 family)